MAETRDLLFRFLGDTKNLDKATRGANKSLSKTEKGAKGVAKGWSAANKAVAGFIGAVGAAELARFAFDAAKMAEAANEAAASAEKVLGPALDTLRGNLEDTRRQLGFNIGEFDAMAARLGLLSEGFGLSNEAQGEFIEFLVRTGGDLAAFNGRVGDSEQAIDALTAAIRGEFDPLEQWGVKIKQSEINERALELQAADATGELTDQEAQIAALASLIEEKAAPAIGALADAEGSLASQTNEARARFEDLKIQLGNQLIPVFNFLLGELLKSLQAWDRLTDSTTFYNTRLGVLVASTRRFVNGFINPIVSGIRSIVSWFERAASIVGAFTSRLGKIRVPNIRLPSLPRFQTGGVVPGPVGSPQPIIAHGGEVVTNPRLGQGAGGGGGISVTVNAGVGDANEIARVIVDTLQTYNQTNGAIPITVRSAEGA